MDVFIRLALLQYMMTQAVLKCPTTVADWNTSSLALQCKKPNYYHCLRDERGNIAQQCLEKVWIQTGMCPEYNSGAKRIDVYDCKSHQNNCPTSTFWSNAVYVYPGCFITSDPTSTTSQIHVAISSTYYDTSGFEGVSKDMETSKENESDNTTVIIGVLSVTVLIIVIVSAVFIWWKIRRRVNRGSQSITNHDESRLSDRETRIDEEGRATDQLLERQGVTSSLESKQNSTDKRLKGLVSNLQMNSEKKILLIISQGSTDKETIEKFAMSELKETIILENDFKLWMKNKNKNIYVFQDWINFNRGSEWEKIKNILVDVLQAITDKGTKFVLDIPLAVWSENSELQDMEKWPFCRKKYNYGIKY